MESEDISNLILANAFRKINRPYLALIGLVVNLICFYKHWSHKHYVLEYTIKSCYQFVFTCNFITIALDHFAVQVFVERYLSQKLSCQILLVINDIIFCSNLNATLVFILAALKLRLFYCLFCSFSVMNCVMTMYSILTAPPAIRNENNALICGFVTAHRFTYLQLAVDSVVLICTVPIIYKLHATISKRFSVRSLSYWCQMLPFAALTLIAELLLVFHWVEGISSHDFILANEMAEFMTRSLGWILLPMFMMCVQFGFLFQPKRIEEIPEVILEMNDLEPFTFQRHASDSTLRSEV